MSATTRLSAKGQVVIPRRLRHARHWDAGTEFDVVETADGVLLRPRGFAKVATIDSIAGMLRHPGPPVSLEDMQRGIDAAMAERWSRKSKA